MNRKDIAINLYKKMSKEEKDSIIYLYIVYCLKNSIKYYNKKIKVTDLIEIVHDYYLDTEIQIDRICDILVEHYEELINNDYFNINHYVELYS